MTRYELYLALHIVAAVVWVGGGTMAVILGGRAMRLQDSSRMASLMQDLGALATKVFIPSSLAVLLLGVLMVVDGPWSFGSLWIVLGLVGFLATFLTGKFVFEPRSIRIGEMLAGGKVSDAAVAEMGRMLILARVDTVVLFLVVVDMAIKPTGEDVGVLVAMAAVLVAGLWYIWARLRAMDSPRATVPATG